MYLAAASQIGLAIPNRRVTSLICRATMWMSLHAVLNSYGLAAEISEPTIHPRAQRLPFDHQGPFVRLASGEIVAIDESHMLRSSDNGSHWTTHPLFTPDQQAKCNLRVSNERVLFRAADGTLIAAFMNMNEKHWTWDDAQHDAPGAILPTYAMRSADDGRSWESIQKLHDDWTGAMRGIIQTTSGRIVFTSMRMLHNPGRHSVVTYSSLDNGRTWRSSNVIDLGGRGHHGGATEGTLVQRRDGMVWMLIRTNLMQFWTALSNDDGQNWRILQPSGIPASSAPGLITRLASGRLLLLWNRPYPEGHTEHPLRGGDGIWSETPVSNHRAELSAAFSDDEGETWTPPVVLARKENASLAYPYLFEASAGELWITTMQGGVRIRIREADI